MHQHFNFSIPMKAKTFLLGSLTIALAACSQDDNLVTNTNDGQATFTASIAGQNKTRAFDQSWESNDQIGITCTTGGKTYTNVAYQTTTGNSNFSVFTTGEDIYYQDDQTVNFTAYYPWNTLADGTAIAADTRVQQDQKTFDFLYATATGSKASPNVAFAFNHKMTKMVLTIKKGDDLSYDEVKSAILTLQGFKNNGTFSVSEGTATATGDLCDAWTFAGNTTEATYNAPLKTDDTSETVSYTFILFPQAFDSELPFSATVGNITLSATLDFTTANKDAGDNASINEWVAGRQYNMSVTLNKTGITVNSCTITNWNQADGGNVDAQ